MFHYFLSFILRLLELPKVRAKAICQLPYGWEGASCMTLVNNLYLSLFNPPFFDQFHFSGGDTVLDTSVLYCHYESTEYGRCVF